MTRAAALALRTAGTLLENCVVVITDGPVIGTAGNTSPTEIELQPVTPSDLGEAAIVHTTFSTSGWGGTYDIDTNSITYLKDDFGNEVKDVDVGASTVHTQFPWHRGSGTMKGNRIQDSTLGGWDTAAGIIIDNNIQDANVDLTGHTAGNFAFNTVGAGVALFLAGNSAVQDNEFSTINGAAGTLVQNAGTGALTVQGSKLTDNFALRLAGSGALSFLNSVGRQHSSGQFDVQVNSAGSVTISDSDLMGNAVAAAPLIVDGAPSNTLAITRSVVRGGTFTRSAAAAADATFNDSNLTEAVFSHTGAAPLNVDSTTMETAGIALSASAGLLDISTSQLRTGFNLNKGGAQTLTVAGSEFVGGLVATAATVDAVGAGFIRRTRSVNSTISRAGAATGSGNWSVDDSLLEASSLIISGGSSAGVTSSLVTASTVNWTAARGLVIVASTLQNSTVNANRTNPTNTDTATALTILGGSTFTLTGATDAGGTGATYSGIEVVGASSLSCDAPFNGVQANNLRVAGGSTLTLQGAAARAFRIRVDAGSALTLVGVAVSDSIQELSPSPIVTSLAQSNRLRNKSFDDWG